ncbi:hypothetical protein VPH35_117531 [Triticum aestivum]
MCLCCGGGRGANVGPLVPTKSLPGGEHAVAVGALPWRPLPVHVLVPLAFHQCHRCQRLRGRRRRRSDGRRAAAAPAAAHVAGAVTAESLVGTEYLLARAALEPCTLLHRRRIGGGERVTAVAPVVRVVAVAVAVPHRRPGVAGEHHEGQRHVLLRRGCVGHRAQRLGLAPRSGGVRALGVRRGGLGLTLAIREGDIGDTQAALGILPERVDWKGLLEADVVVGGGGEGGGRGGRR